MASHGPVPDTLTARFELADTIAEAAGALSDCDRAVLELACRHGLRGADLAAALEVSVDQARTMAFRMRQTIEGPLGALLVARRVRRNPCACLELATILNGWDGYFTAPVRQRVIRHIECCLACELERRRLVASAALPGSPPVFIPAPDWLRAETLHRIRLSPASPPVVTLVPPAIAVSAVGHRRTRRLAALVLAALLTATVITGRSLSFDPSPSQPPSLRPAATSSADIVRSASPTIPVEPPTPAPDPAPPTPSRAATIDIRTSEPAPRPVREPVTSASPSPADIRAARSPKATRPGVTTPPRNSAVTAAAPPRPDPGTSGRHRHTTKSPAPAQPPQAADNVS